MPDTFADNCHKLLDAIGSVELMPGWSPLRAVKAFRDKKEIWNIFPDNVEISFCSNYDGRIAISSNLDYHPCDEKINTESLDGLGTVKYYENGVDFFAFLDATDQTSQIAQTINRINESTCRRARDVLEQHLSRMSTGVCRVDAYNINYGSEKLYALRSEWWMQEYPALLGIDNAAIDPDEQQCWVEVLCPQISDSINEVTWNTVGQDVPIESGLVYVRDLMRDIDRNNIHEHSAKIKLTSDWKRTISIDSTIQYTEDVNPYDDPCETDGLPLGYLIDCDVLLLETLANESEVCDMLDHKSVDDLPIWAQIGDDEIAHTKE